MPFHILRVYFKAAVLVPFYVAIAVVLMFGIPLMDKIQLIISDSRQDNFFQMILQIPFFSGIIGVVTLSAFLNLNPKVANNLLYSLLAWMLLPYGTIAYLLSTQVDWSVMNRPGSIEMLIASVLCIVCFFHVTGIIISYIDFRATVVKNLKEQEQKEDVLVSEIDYVEEVL